MPRALIALDLQGIPTHNKASRTQTQIRNANRRDIVSAANNTAFNALPRFLWAESRDEAGLSECEYLTHTRHPRFVCRIDEVPHLVEQFEAAGAVLNTVHLQMQHDSQGRPAALTSIGLVFSGFAWIDQPAHEAELVEVIRAAIADWQAREDEYEQLNSAPN